MKPDHETLRRLCLPLALLFLPLTGWAADPSSMDAAASALESRIIAWRRDIHEHPELSNREFRTSKLVAEHLEGLGMAVETGIAHTGVVGILEGGRPGPLVALRADMDALPVTEETGLPFASKVRTTYNGQETGVMHACGHDAHVAILMGAAELLAANREKLPGSVMFIFQPAEEKPPSGEEGGASLMLAEGLFKSRKPDAVFGLHAVSFLSSGVIGYHAGPTWASEDTFEIIVSGRQTHGARPWQGVDPIVVSAQIVLGVQTIASRQVNVTKAPSIISIGSIHGGIRSNIIPDEVKMIGTIRSFDAEMRADIKSRMKNTVTSIADAAGASAVLEVDPGYPVLVNDPALTAKMLPTLRRVTGEDRLIDSGVFTWAEDFSYFARETPGLYLGLGVTAPDVDPAAAPPNHSPRFLVDDDALVVGVRALTQMAVEYLETG